MKTATLTQTKTKTITTTKMMTATLALALANAAALAMIPVGQTPLSTAFPSCPVMSVQVKDPCAAGGYDSVVVACKDTDEKVMIEQKKLSGACLDQDEWLTEAGQYCQQQCTVPYYDVQEQE